MNDEKNSFGQRVAKSLEQLLGDLAVSSFKRPWLTLFLLTCFTLFAGHFAFTLHLDSDFSRLLPKNAPSVKALEELESRTGGIGTVTVLLKGEDPAVLADAAQAISKKLAALPEMRSVEDRLPIDFFKDRALWFMETAQLKEIAERMRARQQYEKRHQMPMWIDLAQTPPPDLGLSAILDRTMERFGSWGVFEKAMTRPEGEDRLVGRFASKDGHTVVLFAKPTARASDLAFDEQIIAEVRKLLDSELQAFPNVSAKIAGRYAQRIEQQAALRNDLTTALSWAVAGLLLYLFFHFRRMGAAIQVLLPLCLSLCWTFGLTAFWFDGLNLLTGMVAAILLGLGLDHGIHLLGRFESEWAGGKTPVDAIRCAFGRTGRAVLAAGITTVAGFLGLAFSDFRAFHEFGVVAAVGCTGVVLAYVLTLPALCALVGRNRRALKPTPISPYFTRLPINAPLVFWMTVLPALFLMAQSGDERFESEFAVLEDAQLPTAKLDAEVVALLGYTQTPIAVLAHSKEEEQRFSEILRRLQKESKEIDFVLALSDLVPEIDDPKKEAMAAVKQAAELLPEAQLSELERSQLHAFREMAEVPPFTRESLPLAVRDRFLSQQALPDEPGILLIFPNISQSNGLEVSALTARLRDALGGRKAPIAGEALVLADVYSEVKREAPSVLLLTFFLVLAVLCLSMGRVSSALLPLLTAVCTLFVSMGASALRGDALNYINIVMIPVLFGVSVDGAVHLMLRFEQDGEVVALGDSGRAVTGALVTTILGFGPLCFASHPGLSSLGRLAVLGLTCNLILCILTVSSFLALRAQSQDAVYVGRGFFTTQSEWQSGESKRFSKFLRLCATVCLAGFSPKAPKILGALMALPLAYLLAFLEPWIRAAVLAVIFGFGLWIAQLYLGRHRDRDTPELVIDEMVGCLIACAFLPYQSFWPLLAFGGFCLFNRLKPWPVSLIAEKIRGGLGVMLDDLVAGVLCGLILRAIYMGF